MLRQSIRAAYYKLYRSIVIKELRKIITRTGGNESISKSGNMEERRIEFINHAQNERADKSKQ